MFLQVATECGFGLPPIDTAGANKNDRNISRRVKRQRRVLIMKISQSQSIGVDVTGSTLEPSVRPCPHPQLYAYE